MNKTIGNQDFEVLQEQTNSDEAKQIERQWKKKVQKEKDRCYTKLMLIAIAVMVIIFIILISFLSEDKKHVQLKTISYKNTDYIYLQSNIPHLKFLYPKQQDTQQIKYLKGLGILYPDLIKWIQSNLQQNMKVLFIPNEKSAVNVLGISLGYYLNANKGGSLDIVVSQIKYQEMTIKNIQQMNNERVQGFKIPINLIIDGIQLDYSKYNLIVIENNNQYKKIINAQNAKIIIIKNKIQLNIFPNHKKFGIVKGKTNDKVRQFQFKYGYAIIPYDINNINTLLIPKSIQDIQECQQKNIMLKNQQTALRNIAIYLHNKTFTQTTIYYGLQNNVAIKLIAQIPTISKLYSKHDFNLVNVNPIKNKDINNVQNNKQIIFSEINYYIVNYDSSIIYNIKDKDTFFILLQNEEEVNNLLKQYINEKITMMSPYNNGGCFYPPAISSYKKLQPFIPFFMILRSSK